MRLFKKTRWFEAYFEVEESRILDRFYDRRSENGGYEFWLGRCYLSVHFYRRKLAAGGVGDATA